MITIQSARNVHRSGVNVRSFPFRPGRRLTDSLVFVRHVRVLPDLRVRPGHAEVQKEGFTS